MKILPSPKWVNMVCLGPRSWLGIHKYTYLSQSIHIIVIWHTMSNWIELWCWPFTNRQTSIEAKRLIQWIISSSFLINQIVEFFNIKCLHKSLIFFVRQVNMMIGTCWISFRYAGFWNFLLMSLELRLFIMIIMKLRSLMMKRNYMMSQYILIKVGVQQNWSFLGKIFIF